MALSRSSYVAEGQEGVYHCFSRCVRRAFLCGFDALTGRDFSHRKAWVVDRLRFLAAIFAIEVLAYAVMEDHDHTIVRTRPDIVASWSDREVARRWRRLCPRHRRMRGGTTSAEEEICAVASNPERIKELRRRLCSLSWFMGQLNEFIARRANKEDKVKGRFWEGRFKCQALLDEAAIAVCMVYVDLNPVRAGRARTPEESDFTSIQERIRAWQKGTLTTASGGRMTAGDLQSPTFGKDMGMQQDAAEAARLIPEPVSAGSGFFEAAGISGCWVCPIESDSRRRGILGMTTAEYIDLVDRTGRMTRPDKRGAIDPDLAPILLRIGANPDAWLDTVSRFGSKFRLAAGLASSLRSFAERLGKRWFQGVATARIAFGPARTQVA